MTNETLYEVFGQINETFVAAAHSHTARFRKPIWEKRSVMAACFAGILLTAFLLVPSGIRGQYSFPPGNPPEGTIADDPDSHPSQSSSDSNVELVVNDLKSPPVMTDVDVQITHYDALSPDARKAFEEDFLSFTNITYDSFLTLIPEELRTNMVFYALSAKSGRDSAEYKLHDYVFACQSDDGVQATIALCNFEEPIRDCFFEEETSEVSSIHGTPVTIYGYGDLYLANFSHEGLYYDIETANMDLNSFEALLVNILF